MREREKPITQTMNASAGRDERGDPFRALDRSQAAFGDIPCDELEREVINAVDEARAELRAEREHAADTA
jgi:hypothetical protein